MRVGGATAGVIKGDKGDTGHWKPLLAGQTDAIMEGSGDTSLFFYIKDENEIKCLANKQCCSKVDISAVQ